MQFDIIELHLEKTLHPVIHRHHRGIFVAVKDADDGKRLLGGFVAAPSEHLLSGQNHKRGMRAVPCQGFRGYTSGI
jgi:hypothetical protein